MKSKRTAAVVLRHGVLGEEERGYALCGSRDDKQKGTLDRSGSKVSSMTIVIGGFAGVRMPRPEKEEDRVRHIDACSAQTGPIFLAYRKNAVIRRLPSA